MLIPYDYLINKTVDWEWQNAFVDYLIEKNMNNAIYWALNPESLETGGIYTHAYDSISNVGGWGTWEAPDQRKLDLLYRLWDKVPPTSTPIPPSTPAPSGGDPGDVDGNGVIDIVDALMIAQYYVGLNPAGFISLNADVDCNESIDIVDALLVARYYVGLINSFTCI